MKEDVEKVVDKVRPYVQMHGGDVHIVDITDGVVRLQISGACTHCSLADLTYNKMLGSILQKEVPGIKGVVIDK
jgi:Fe-S cluster biogenesis protein NfuA